MAGKFVVGHEHCGVCGACLLHKDQLHRCPQPVELEILAVYLAHTSTMPARSAFRAMNGGGDREDAFNDRVARQGKKSTEDF